MTLRSDEISGFNFGVWQCTASAFICGTPNDTWIKIFSPGVLLWHARTCLIIEIIMMEDSFGNGHRRNRDESTHEGIVTRDYLEEMHIVAQAQLKKPFQLQTLLTAL